MAPGAQAYSQVKKITIPFHAVDISAESTLMIQYNNKDRNDAVICACDSESDCKNYEASWKFKGEIMHAHGPNYINWLELYLGLPPECPLQNADQAGNIIFVNTNKKSLSMTCYFSSLGAPHLR